MTQTEAVKRWTQSAEEDWQVANDLYRAKRYAHCLFFCHLTLEKIIKAAIIAKSDDAPPITHNLVKLAQSASLSVTKEQIGRLTEITTFNIEARYDVYKRRLHQKATPEYTKNFLDITKVLYVWIKKQITE